MMSLTHPSLVTAVLAALATAAWASARSDVAKGHNRAGQRRGDYFQLTSLLVNGVESGLDVDADKRDFAAAVATGPIHVHPEHCEELCKKHSSKDAYLRECITDCRVKTDLSHGKQGKQALRRFAADHSHATREAYKDIYNHTFENECIPHAPSDLEVDFEEVDTNSDGFITRAEALEFGHYLCVPDDLEEEIFARNDQNQDGTLDPDEWRLAGEDTVLEYEIERFIEEAEAPGASELPPFDELDKNADGVLEDYELFDGFYYELTRHYTNLSENTRNHIEEVFWDHADEILPSVDIDGDGVVSRDEFDATHGKLDDIREKAANMSPEPAPAPAPEFDVAPGPAPSAEAVPALAPSSEATPAPAPLPAVAPAPAPAAVPAQDSDVIGDEVSALAASTRSDDTVTTQNNKLRGTKATGTDIEDIAWRAKVDAAWAEVEASDRLEFARTA